MEEEKYRKIVHFKITTFVLALLVDEVVDDEELLLVDVGSASCKFDG